ncbi:MAG TPA: glutamate--tRNA ligase [candidate division Zixibacteria bacterium]|nr:glutamate--tRNA ligase [candidate division Zixibacteria bacterium]
MTAETVRVRIAPSPSGYLHVGTARTAIFNWLYARKHGGAFLIRIEDTDAERIDNSLVQPILDALTWLGLESDEPVQYQSKRHELHREYVGRFIASGHGYRCFCTKERLAVMREQQQRDKQPPRYDRHCANLSESDVTELLAENTPHVIRLRVPEGGVSYQDMILGDISRDSFDIEDFVIARADGSALYNFAVVVDDHDMRITHVLRGNDHITNTFKQILIYRALELPVPEFGHVPLLLRPDKRKVSKRLGDKDVAEYGAEGILPQTMFNYLCLLGWSPKDGREIMLREEIIEAFSAEGINASNPVFDEPKLVAFNKEHIKTAPVGQLYDVIAPELVSAGLIDTNWLELDGNRRYVECVIDMMRERLRYTRDFVDQTRFFFSDEYTYDEQGAAKQFVPEAADRLRALAARFERAEPFDHDTLESELGALSDDLEIKRAALIHPTRLAVSGMTVGPGLFDLLVTIGRERTVERMRRAAEYIDSRG